MGGLTAGGRRLRLLIWDACVLIDFYEADPALFRLMAEHVGKVHVPLPILEEVQQLDESAAATLGITVDDLPGEVLLEAAARRGGLSFENRICLMAMSSGRTGAAMSSQDSRTLITLARRANSPFGAPDTTPLRSDASGPANTSAAASWIQWALDTHRPWAHINGR